MTNIELSKKPLQSGDEYEATNFIGTLPQLTIAEGVRLVHSSLQTVDASDSKLKKLYLTNVNIKGGVFVNTDCQEASWHSTRVEQSRLTGLKLSDALIKDCEFENCAMNLSLFRFANLKEVTFSNCNLIDADFSNANLKRVKFEKCELGGADFTQTMLEEVDLRKASISGIRGVTNLKGAIISSEQLFQLAYELATNIGIKVQDQ